MLINGGVNPHTNETVVPKSVIEAVTAAYSIEVGYGLSPDESIVGYGMGWSRSTYKGHEVCIISDYALTSAESLVAC